MLVNMRDKVYAQYYHDKYTYTGSWTENADKSIYGKDSEVQHSEYTPREELLAEMAEKPGFIEEMLIGLVVAITNGLYLVMDAIGISIDNVVYGRVGGHTRNGIALFRFELHKGNPYGVVGSVIYNIIAGIAIIFIVVSIFAKFSRAMYYSGSGNKWSEFKSSIGISILSLALISLMPYFLDIGLYLADIILHTVSNDGSVQLFGTTGGFDIVASFKESAKLSIVDSLIYLSTVILSLYFAAIYVGYALTMVVLFICFPIVCVGMGFDKKLISEWAKQVFSILIIPIMDCILLMIPVYFSLLPNAGSMSVIKIFVCAMIVPARNIIRQLLGLRSTGMELTGVATMMGAMRLAGAAGGAISKARGGRKAALEDENMANFYSELAMNENPTESAGGNSSGGGDISGGGVSLSTGGAPSPGTSGGAVSTGSVSYMGRGVDDPSARSIEKYANIHNFENQAFRGGLSNQKMAELYKNRADHRIKTAGYSALGSLAGGVLGAGSGMFMGPGYATHIGALGVMAGGAAGGMIAERGSVGNSPVPEMYSMPDRLANLPRVEGDVVSDFEADGTSLINIGDAETGTNPYTSVKDETLNLCYANKPVADHIIKNDVDSYMSHNGVQLKNIYGSILKSNKDNGMNNVSNNAIRNELRNKATEAIIADFTPEFSKKSTRSSDQMINQDVISRMREFQKRCLSDPNIGYFSEDVFDTFDWMPRRDAGGESSPKRLKDGSSGEA